MESRSSGFRKAPKKWVDSTFGYQVAVEKAQNEQGLELLITLGVLLSGRLQL